MTVENQSAGSLAPSAASERIEVIDTVRGVAVLGILVMNIYAYAMSAAAYSNPLAAGGTEWYNIGTWYATHLFFDQKFLAIFSLLFGGGLVLMSERADSRGINNAGTWYRRCFWLAVIGSMHGYLLWFGDILFHYAVIGMLIFPFRRLPPMPLVKIGCALLLLGLLFSFVGGTGLEQLQEKGEAIAVMESAGESLSDEDRDILEKWEKASIFMKPPEQQVEEDTVAYLGTYSDIVRYRAPTYSMMQTDGLFGFVIYRVGGLMLLGMALMKLGILSGQQNERFYERMMLAGYGLGIPMVLLGAWNLQAHQWDFLWTFRIGNLPNYIGSILVAFGHIALVMLIVRRGIFSGLMDRFAAAGRMAFTSYLMHSLVLTTVFYGYGFGLYGQVSRIWQMAFVVAVIGLQLWFSPWWLTRFRFGPMEWLWRSLTYWQPQPMRK